MTVVRLTFLLCFIEWYPFFQRYLEVHSSGAMTIVRIISFLFLMTLVLKTTLRSP
jgi:hypothetical protein